MPEWSGLLRRRRAGGGGPGAAAGFRALFHLAPEALALLDRTGRVVQANPALLALVGPAVAPRPGGMAAHLLAPADRPGLATLLAEALAGREPTPCLAAPGDPTAPPDSAWQLHVTPLADQQGGLVLLRIHDLTPERRAEARLAAADRFQTVGRLAGGIAHDFNNLLGVILGSAEAVRRLGVAAAEPDLQQLEAAAQRGAALVRQLLAFARQQALQPRILDLNAAISGIAPFLGRMLGQGITLEVALEQPGRRVRMDPTQLEQVVLNLAVNARDAMAGSGRLRLATGHATILRPDGEGPAALPPGRYAVLEVADDGPGIPPATLRRIFEPFFTTKLETGGTGLGLATVQGIIAQSGGHIAVESRPGEGTRFRIHLPRQEAPADPLPAPPAVSDGPSPPAAPTPLRVLLVEDEPALRRLAERVLQRAGHAVLAADCAEAALELAASGPPPDLLMSDVAMPGMDGLELARRLRTTWPALRVVLVSGYAERILDRDLAGEGISFLAKPYLPAELLAAIAPAG